MLGLSSLDVLFVWTALRFPGLAGAQMMAQQLAANGTALIMLKVGMLGLIGFAFDFGGCICMAVHGRSQL